VQALYKLIYSFILHVEQHPDTFAPPSVLAPVLGSILILLSPGCLLSFFMDPYSPS